MLGLNNVQIIGNLGGTPEMKYLNNSDHVVNFSVAVNERWKNRNGESQERTTWLRIVAFNGIGSACAEHLKKGDGVYVEGRLQIREYEDKDHVERTALVQKRRIPRMMDRCGDLLHWRNCSRVAISTRRSWCCACAGT
jgi:single-strand DNA-binding protein